MNETKSTGKKRSASAADKSKEVAALAIAVLNFLNKKSDKLPDELDQIRPVDLNKVFKEVNKSWHGKVETGRAGKVLGLLKTDWKGGKSWIDTYISALRLADKLSLDKRHKVKIVAAAIESYGKSREQIQSFVEKIGVEAGQLLVAVFPGWINKEPEGANLHVLLNDWSSGFFVVLRPKISGNKTMPGVRETDADDLLLFVKDLDYQAHQQLFSNELVVVLQSIFSYASESARNQFVESETGRSILAPSVIAGPVKSGTGGERESKQEYGVDGATIENLLRILKSRLEEGDDARSRLIQMETKVKKIEMQVGVLDDERSKLKESLQKSRNEIRILKSEHEGERAALMASEAGLKENLEHSEKKIEKLAKDLDHLVHQKGNVQEDHRKEFSGDIARILDKEGKAAWERVKALGDDQKVLRVNLKNLLNKIAAKFEVKSPTG